MDLIFVFTVGILVFTCVSAAPTISVYNHIDCTNPLNQILLHPHPTSCSFYLECVHGKPMERPCGPGTEFSPSIGVCVHIWQSDCTAKEKPDKSEPDSSPGTKQSERTTEKLKPTTARSELEPQSKQPDVEAQTELEPVSLTTNKPAPDSFTTEFPLDQDSDHAQDDSKEVKQSTTRESEKSFTTDQSPSEGSGNKDEDSRELVSAFPQTDIPSGSTENKPASKEEDFESGSGEKPTDPEKNEESEDMVVDPKDSWEEDYYDDFIDLPEPDIYYDDYFNLPEKNIPDFSIETEEVDELDSVEEPTKPKEENESEEVVVDLKKICAVYSDRFFETAYPNDCSKYIICKFGTPVVQTCANGKYFNPIITTCSDDGLKYCQKAAPLKASNSANTYNILIYYNITNNNVFLD